MTHSSRQVRWLLVVVWIIALCGAFAVDRRVAQWVNDTKPVNKNNRRTKSVLFVVKLPGYFGTTLCVAGLLLQWHRRNTRAAVALILSGVGAGVLYHIIKWLTGRHRPIKGIDPFGFHPFAGGTIGLFWHPEDALCFPSGHASLAFASAMCLAMLVPRVGWIFFVIATATAVERVLENAHYVSDVVAGAGLGITVGWLITRAILSIDMTPSKSGSISTPDLATNEIS